MNKFSLAQIIIKMSTRDASNKNVYITNAEEMTKSTGRGSHLNWQETARTK